PTIPIVFSIASDPIESGIVQNLARPEANVTGISIQSLELVAKRLELISELVPQAKVVGLLVNPEQAITGRVKEQVERAVAPPAVRLKIIDATSENEINQAFAEFARLQTDALVVGPDAFFYDRREQIVKLAARHSLPATYELSGFVAAGGLM